MRLEGVGGQEARRHERRRLLQQNHAARWRYVVLLRAGLDQVDLLGVAGGAEGLHCCRCELLRDRTEG